MNSVIPQFWVDTSFSPRSKPQRTWSTPRLFSRLRPRLNPKLRDYSFTSSSSKTKALLNKRSYNRGMAMVEAVIILPALILLLYYMECIGEGWSRRIQNRVISRYVSTISFRTGRIPSKLCLTSTFDLKNHDIENLKIKSADSTELTFMKILGNSEAIKIQHRYPLGRKNERLFDPIF